MNPIFNIQTEVRIDDVLALILEDTTTYFICHNVAYLIRDKLALILDYKEFEASKLVKSSVNIFGIPYFYISYDSLGDARIVPEEFCMVAQILEQLNSFHTRMSGDYPYVGTEILNDSMLGKYLLRTGSYFSWSRLARIKFIEAILQYDADAVLSINI